MSTIRLAFAGNRRIGLQALEMLLENDVQPVALLLPDGEKAEFVDEMRQLLPDVQLLSGNVLKTDAAVEMLRSLQLDYLLSVHYPYIISKAALDLPTIGALNLHPAFLPYNRGWHTPTWAIEEGTPYGATLHWIDEGVDTGDIALQKQIDVTNKHDTAHSLYQRALAAEVEVFHEAIPHLIAKTLPRIPQTGEGTLHSKKDLASIQKLDPSLSDEARNRRIRALTTNNPDEAAYEEINGEKRYVRE